MAFIHGVALYSFWLDLTGHDEGLLVKRCCEAGDVADACIDLASAESFDCLKFAIEEYQDLIEDHKYRVSF